MPDDLPTPGGEHGENTGPEKPKLPPELEARKWKPGQSGNPSGRPKGTGSIAHEIRKIISKPAKDYPTYAALMESLKIPEADRETITVGELVAHAAIKQAVRGKAGALGEVLERVDGKVPQTIRDEGRLGVSDVLEIVRQSGVSPDVMDALERKVEEASRSIRIRVDFTD